MDGNYTDFAHPVHMPHRAFANAKPQAGLAEFTELAEALPGDFVPLRLELRCMDLYPRQQTFEVTRAVAVVGRHSEADIRLAFADVSRRHCRFEFIDGCWHVCDLNSLNGLHVNGQRTRETVVQEGDFIRIGSVTLVVLNKTSSQVAAWDMLQSIADSLQ